MMHYSGAINYLEPVSKLSFSHVCDFTLTSILPLPGGGSLILRQVQVISCQISPCRVQKLYLYRIP